MWSSSAISKLLLNFHDVEKRVHYNPLGWFANTDVNQFRRNFIAMFIHSGVSFLIISQDTVMRCFHDEQGASDKDTPQHTVRPVPELSKHAKILWCTVVARRQSSWKDMLGRQNVPVHVEPMNSSVPSSKEDELPAPVGGSKGKGCRQKVVPTMGKQCSGAVSLNRGSSVGAIVITKCHSSARGQTHQMWHNMRTKSPRDQVLWRMQLLSNVRKMTPWKWVSRQPQEWQQGRQCRQSWQRQIKVCSWHLGCWKEISAAATMLSKGVCVCIGRASPNWMWMASTGFVRFCSDHSFGTNCNFFGRLSSHKKAARTSILTLQVFIWQAMEFWVCWWKTSSNEICAMQQTIQKKAAKGHKSLQWACHTFTMTLASKFPSKTLFVLHEVMQSCTLTWFSHFTALCSGTAQPFSQDPKETTMNKCLFWCNGATS